MRRISASASSLTRSRVTVRVLIRSPTSVGASSVPAHSACARISAGPTKGASTSATRPNPRPNGQNGSSLSASPGIEITPTAP